MATATKLEINTKETKVDISNYRGMVGSLLYLTASRPDIMFSTCLCARFQADPRESHLIAIKRIFRYLKGTPNLGIWYPRDSRFDLIGYLNADYAGCRIDRKSTIKAPVNFLEISLSHGSARNNTQYLLLLQKLNTL